MRTSEDLLASWLHVCNPGCFQVALCNTCKMRAQLSLPLLLNHKAQVLGKRRGVTNLGLSLEKGMSGTATYSRPPHTKAPQSTPHEGELIQSFTHPSSTSAWLILSLPSHWVSASSLLQTSTKSTLPFQSREVLPTLPDTLFYYPVWEPLPLHFKSTSLTNVSSKSHKTGDKAAWWLWLQADIALAVHAMGWLWCSTWDLQQQHNIIGSSLSALPLADTISVINLLGSPVLLDPNQLLLEDHGFCLLERSCSEFHACSLTGDIRNISHMTTSLKWSDRRAKNLAMQRMINGTSRSACLTPRSYLSGSLNAS